MAPLSAPIALTSGEPAGIGPDLCILLARELRSHPLVVLADRQLLEARARQLRVALTFTDYVPGRPVETKAGRLTVLHVPLAVPAVAGRPDPRNAPYVLALLNRALAGCIRGEFAALVTGPVHKGVINEAGIRFQGHTEYLQEKSGTPHVVMMLAGGGLRVALATTHHPLRAVPDLITREGLTATLRVLHHDLSRRFGLMPPRICVAGLNPHAGEGGHLGREESEIIQPTLEALREEGLDLSGPWPADTLFTRDTLRRCDCVLAMYHDQGLPVLKFASFGAGVNITLGLPFVRTSVDHGTALSLAGTGQIETGSLRMAIDTAVAMASHC